MNTSEESRRRLAAEVLELGQSLFEIALEGRSYRPKEGEEVAAYPIEEIRVAADEFFTALWLMMRIGA
jgi:hypothetical protein